MINNEQNINALKMLSVDMINKANSGHTGIAIGIAPLMYTLFKNHLNINRKNEEWLGRDRFVLSAGHGSAILYATLFAFKLGFKLKDLKEFRQLGSRTPGHPEIELPFVETTTGPLGQGIASGVGMAIAERYLNSRLKKVINNHTFVVCGDGCLQEGQSYEAMSIAGNLKLNKLILIHDSNNVQIDSLVTKTNSENMKKRVESMNWNYLLVKDMNDIKSIDAAIIEAKASTVKPTYIEVRSIIGQDTVWAGTPNVHGKPLGAENRELFSKKLNWNLKPFQLPKGLFSELNHKTDQRVEKRVLSWKAKFKKLNKSEKEILSKIMKGTEWQDLELPVYEEPVSTRELTKRILKTFEDKLSLIGGSADVAGSTFVMGSNGDQTSDNPSGQNIKFGVRENAMAGIANGIATFPGLVPMTATFLSFADYEKPSLRLAALMRRRIMAFFSHDSLFVGEDGPTHQPIEQVGMLRSIPGLNVYRPYNSEEFNHAVKCSIVYSPNNPTAIVTTRQNLSNERVPEGGDVTKGGYIIRHEVDELKFVILASGSEVDYALKVVDERNLKGVRVVSVPSLNILARQSKEYIQSLVPEGIQHLVAEATNDYSWCKTFPNAHFKNLKRYGKSGPGLEVYEDAGFIVKKDSEHLKGVLKKIS